MLKTSAIILVLITLGVTSAQLNAAPITYFQLISEPGDWVGGGQSYFRDLSTGKFDVQLPSDLDGDGLVDYIFLRYLGNEPGIFAHIFFATNQVPGANLAPGLYDDADRAPFARPGHPGLDWGMDGRGCNTITGNFTVLGSQFDYSSGTPKLVSLGVIFEQHCEGAAPALRGTFYYNFEPGSQVPEPGTLFLLAFGCCGLIGYARLKQSVGSGQPSTIGNRAEYRRRPRFHHSEIPDSQS